MNPILLLGSLIGALAMVLPWLSLKPNRLLAGKAVSLIDISTPFAYLALFFWVVVLLCAVVPVPPKLMPKKLRSWLSSVAVASALLCACFYLSQGSAELLAEAGKYARVSVTSGAWLGLLAFYFSIFGLRRDTRFGAAVPSLLVLLFAFVTGMFNNLGPWLEYAGARDVFAQNFLRHILLSLLSVSLAALLGFPLAVLTVRSKRLSAVVLPIISFLQTVPSVALFGLLLPPLAWLGQHVSLLAAVTLSAGLILVGLLLLRVTRVSSIRLLPLLGAFLGGLLLSIMLFQVVIGESKPLTLQSSLADAGVRGIGAAPALFALSLYALLPLVINTVVGLNNVPAAVKDAALGMGMNPRQLFWRTEVPLALPFMMEGLRSSLVLSFGLTTIAALISAGGLGFFILRGVEGSVGDLILLGAVPVVVVALLLDVLLRGATWLLIPKGLRA
ncbi:MAG: ABC transporter permease [Trueperaceae bacterium]